MTELFAVIAITLLAVVSPGADFAMVTRNSLVLSRRAGMLTAVGIGAGCVVHVSYTILGIGLLIQQSIWLFSLIKLAGAAYLVFLGIKMLRSRPGLERPPQALDPISDLAALRAGFLTNVLNPKTTIFVVSLFMQVVQPTTPAAVQIGYGAFIAGAHVAWFMLVAAFFSAGAIRDRLLGIRHWIDRLFGTVLVAFGVVLATTTVSR